MYFLFADIHVNDPQAYVRERLFDSLLFEHPNPAGLSPADVEEQVPYALRAVGAHQVPAARPEDHGPFSANQLEQHELWKRKANVVLSRRLPLAPDEQVEEDFFTYLQEPFLDLPANTAVLRRRTNRMTMYIFFDQVKVVNGDLVIADRPGTPANQAAEIVAGVRPMADFDLNSIAENLGRGLVSGIGGKIGALIFDTILPPSVPSYFGEVYKHISAIFKQQITQNTIDQINGRVSGVNLWVKNTYGPRKQQLNVPRQELLEMLNPIVDKLYTEAIGPLMEDAFKEAGLPVFMITGSMHLALIQEQALVDPDQPDPQLSSFAESVKLNAQTYADFAYSTYAQMKSARENSFSLVTIPSETVCGPKGACHQSATQWYVKDSMTGETSDRYYDDCNHDHQHEAAEKELTRRQTYAIDQLGHPVRILPDWQTLETTPIPPQTG